MGVWSRELGRFVGQSVGKDRYVQTSHDIYLHSTPKQKSERGGHLTKPDKGHIS